MTSTGTDIYARMGINIRELGCVMLEIGDLDLHQHVPPALWYSDPETPWINGPELDPHVTLLFGLMENAHTWRDYVDEVLEGWEPPDCIGVGKFERFGSPDAPYDAVVGRVTFNAEPLREAHGRLSRLPHVSTFPVYEPHVTIGYVLKGTGRYVIDDLNGLRVPHHQALVGGLNYGRTP